MSRQKEFDETEVLDQALELFRARGFKQTSFSDLTTELGVSRQSLYDTYGDKQTLYQSALKRYLDRGADAIRRKLADSGPVRKVFAALFDGMIEGNCANGSPGCLMVNTMVELSPHDADTRAQVAEHAHKLQALLAERLRAAQAGGELARSKDPAALACFFYHTLLGLAVSARAIGDKACLRQTVRLALQVLD